MIQVPSEYHHLPDKAQGDSHCRACAFGRGNPGLIRSTYPLASQMSMRGKHICHCVRAYGVSLYLFSFFLNFSTPSNLILFDERK